MPSTSSTPSAEGRGLDVRILDVLSYEDALKLQEDLVAKRQRDEIPDTLLLLEHPSVYTLGRGAGPDDAPRRAGAAVHLSSRGGEGTWHGPGQTVGYWIRKLEGKDRDLHLHLRRIEDGVIAALGALGLPAERRPGLTGVWTARGKIASIGVAVRSWVTYHGFALNRRVDPEVYRGFSPCGLSAAVMTDLAAHPGLPADRETVDEALISAFSALFGR